MALTVGIDTYESLADIHTWHLIYTGSGVVAGAKKIQLTVAGGATTAEQLCKTWVKYKEIFSL